MAMDITTDWERIRRYVPTCFPFIVLATVDESGIPHATPVGSLMLGPNQRGVYFEIFLEQAPHNLSRNKRVCLIAMQTRRLFWFKSFLKGRFDDAPGLRLLGRAGERREATPDEIQRWRRRVRFLRRFRGHGLLWGNLRYVRDIEFDGVVPIRLGPMSRHLWTETAE